MTVLLAVIAGGVIAAIWQAAQNRFHRRLAAKVDQIKAEIAASPPPQPSMMRDIEAYHIDSERLKEIVGDTFAWELQESREKGEPDSAVTLLAAMDDMKKTIISESRKSAWLGFIQNFVFFLLGLAASYFLQ